MSDMKVIRLVADYSNHVRRVDELFEKIQAESGVTPVLSQFVEQENIARELLNRFLSEDGSDVFGLYKPEEHTSGSTNTSTIADPSDVNMEFYMSHVNLLDEKINNVVNQFSDSLNYLDQQLGLVNNHLGLSDTESIESEISAVESTIVTIDDVEETSALDLENQTLDDVSDQEFEESTNRVENMVSGIELPGSSKQKAELTSDGVAKPASLDDVGVLDIAPTKKESDFSLESAFDW